MRLDSDKTVEEYSNFDHDVCTSLPAIRSDEADSRHASVEDCIGEYLAVGEVDNDNDGDNNGNGNENLEIELLVSPHGAVKLLDRQFCADGMSEDDTDFSIAFHEKVESLTIQRKKQFCIKGLFK